jgi:hypothetical protein
MTAGAAAVHAINEAIKASGVLVRVEPDEFRAILGRTEAPLVIRSEGGFFSAKHHYLTSYKGFAFFTKSEEEIPLPVRAEIVQAGSIYIPG